MQQHVHKLVFLSIAGVILFLLGFLSRPTYYDQYRDLQNEYRVIIQKYHDEAIKNIYMADSLKKYRHEKLPDSIKTIHDVIRNDRTVWDSILRANGFR